MQKVINKRKGSRVVKSIFFSIVGSLLLFLILSGFYLTKYVANKNTYLSPLTQNTGVGTSADINALERLLKQKNIAFSFFSPLDDNSYLVNLTNKEEIIFSSKKPMEAQVSSLQLVISQLTIEGKRLKRLDFRFDKPVVTVQ